MRKLQLILTLILMLAACAPVRSVTPAATPQSLLPNDLPGSAATETPTPMPTPTPTSPIDPAAQPAVLAARIALAGLLGIDHEDIEVVSGEAVEWPDGCLGAGRPDEMCTQAIVPGYRVLLNVGPVQYEYHTNADGSLVKWAGPATVLSSSTTPVLTWQSADCNIFSVTTTQTSIGKCGDKSLTASNALAPENLAIISVWEKKFKSFEVDTPAGKVTFEGKGNEVTTLSEQRMLGEWAAINYEVASSGRSGAAWGLAFSYHREGGIAGFCDDVAVYRSGLVMAAPCGGNGVNYHLTVSQLDQLYDLLDTFSNIDYEHKDPATADAMTMRLTFAGLGKRTALDADIAAINEFAAELVMLGNARRSITVDVEDAKSTLRDFFSALNSGDYIKAAKLYGGDTSQLATWNPDITKDLPKWLERGCTQNGLQCLLPRSVTYRGLDERGGYQFNVEFNNPDGTFFRQGGDAPGSLSNFVFSVIKQNDLWLVMDLPPYVP